MKQHLFVILALGRKKGAGLQGSLDNQLNWSLTSSVDTTQTRKEQETETTQIKTGSKNNKEKQIIRQRTQHFWSLNMYKNIHTHKQTNTNTHLFKSYFLSPFIIPIRNILDISLLYHSTSQPCMLASCNFYFLSVFVWFAPGSYSFLVWVVFTKELIKIFFRNQNVFPLLLSPFVFHSLIVPITLAECPFWSTPLSTLHHIL